MTAGRPGADAPMPRIIAPILQASGTHRAAMFDRVGLKGACRRLMKKPNIAYQ